jgi:divalent metal cation (Fe/Co/Zn/Cd) transporter
MTVEGLVGVVAGVSARSLSLEVFGLDSLIEIISAWAVLSWLRIEMGERSPSAEHDGGEAAERRAARVVAACLLGLALYIVAGVIWSARVREIPHPGIWGFAVAISAIIIMPPLWRAKQKTGQALDSDALREDGVGNLTCGAMAVILLGGLVALRRGWWWADPLASLALGLFVAREGWEAWQHAREGGG